MESLFGIVLTKSDTAIEAAVILFALWVFKRGLERHATQHANEIKEKVESDKGNTKINGWLELVVMTASHPMWVTVKRTNQNGSQEPVVLYVNEAYTQVFGVTNRDYRNRTHYDVWPKEVADKCSQSDLIVFATKRDMRFVAPIPEGMNSGRGDDGKLYEFEKRYIERHDGLCAIVGSMREPLVIDGAAKVEDS